MNFLACLHKDYYSTFDTFFLYTLANWGHSRFTVALTRNVARLVDSSGRYVRYGPVKMLAPEYEESKVAFSVLSFLPDILFGLGFGITSINIHTLVLASTRVLASTGK